MTAALIIASGKTATAEGFDPLAQVGGLTAAQRLILVFQLAGAERVVLVAGANAPALEKQIARMGAVCLCNPNHADAEMLDNVKLGLRYLQGKCSRVLVCPVDVPLFAAETVRRLMDCGQKLAAPSHNHKAGHPLLLSAKLFAAVLGYEGPGGLAGAVKASGEEVHYLNVPDAGVLLDIQKQPDFAHLLAAHSLSRVRPEAKLFLARETPFFGPGPALLLSLIDECDSMAEACRQMGISYSKGWKMVENLEQQLGAAAVVKKRGGRSKGQSRLTLAGKQLLQDYTAFQKESKAQIQAAFEKHLGYLNKAKN